MLRRFQTLSVLLTVYVTFLTGCDESGSELKGRPSIVVAASQSSNDDALPPDGKSSGHAQDGNQRTPKSPFVMVLGTAQDAGYPQAGCDKDCCQPAFRDADRRRYPTSLALVDPLSEQRWILECTPEFKYQLRMLDNIAPVSRAGLGVDGILLTHGHIGHYAGLINLGREVMGTSDVTVHAMPRMRAFLSKNGPWSQLVRLQNISLADLEDQVPVQLGDRISILPFLVPHRDEFTETVGFRILGPRKEVLFIPDIDKWERWDRDINALVQEVDLAFLDATFFDGQELPNRSMDEIPHPFVVESIRRFAGLDESNRSKIQLIHFNHTNPLFNPGSRQYQRVVDAGMNVAEQGSVFGL